MRHQEADLLHDVSDSARKIKELELDAFFELFMQSLKKFNTNIIYNKIKFQGTQKGGLWGWVDYYET